MLTCAQPSGRLHLGNYLGAVANWRAYLDSHECFIGIADLHTLTTSQKPSERRSNILETLAGYLACGLNPHRCHFFAQSHVPGHTELAWILACHTSLGQLERMTQFKDKKQAGRQRGDEGASAGLLYYPILMAADILLYQANVVPAGEDQRQHLELTRDVAERFNYLYADTFVVPKIAIPKTGGKIMSLRHPENKMSKSDQDIVGTLFLDDEAALLRKKIRSAETDSEKNIVASPHKPGITNLLQILSALSKKSMEEIQADFQQASYADLKNVLAEAVVEVLGPIREAYESLRKNKDDLMDILKAGNLLAKERGGETLAKVRREVGLVEGPS